MALCGNLTNDFFWTMKIFIYIFYSLHDVMRPLKTNACRILDKWVNNNRVSPGTFAFSSQPTFLNLGMILLC